jgi:poly(A) polymerase
MNDRIYSLAVEIVRRLFNSGFTAYFAGGYVRDLLLGIQSEEIDIATSAPPEKIISLFPKTVEVGKAFGVIVVITQGINFEVATFRKDHPYLDGRHPDGVDFSTPQHDAERRDFTINGMFYDPLTKELHDYVGGQNDLKQGIIRAIGDPLKRFEEDRLRMMRAVRFSARFHFPIEESTSEAIKNLSHTLLPAVSIERIFQELTKMSQQKSFSSALCQMHQLGLLQTIFPTLKEVSLKQIEKRTAAFPYFPLNTPLIVYLLELFENPALEERLVLCQYLKAKVSDQKCAEFFYHSSLLFQLPAPSPLEWARFYAHDSSPLFLQIQGAKQAPGTKEAFFSEHEKRAHHLEIHIKRLQERKPLITAQLLEKEGIKPGKAMGELLKEGEKIVVNENLDQNEALLRLKASPLWVG